MAGRSIFACFVLLSGFSIRVLALDHMQTPGGEEIPAHYTVEAKYLAQERLKNSGVRLSAYIADGSGLSPYSSPANARLAVQVAQRSLCLNELRPAVWNKCKVFFRGDGKPEGSGRAAYRTQSNFSFDLLKTMTEEATGREMEIAPWVQYGFKVTASDKCSIFKQRPNWLMRDQTGRRAFDFNKVPIAYMNPANPEVVQFLKEMIVGIIKANPAVKKIVIDDNFAWNPKLGYDDFTKKLFTKDHPEVKWPPREYEPTWMKWRSDKVRDAIRQIHVAMRQASPNVRLLLSTNPYPHAYKDALQDPHKWLEEGVIDQVETQIFRGDSERVFDTMDQTTKSLAKNVLNGPESLTYKIQALSRMAARQVNGSQFRNTALLAGNSYKRISAYNLMEQFASARSQSSNISFFHLESLLQPSDGESVEERVKMLQGMFCHPR